MTSFEEWWTESQNLSAERYGPTPIQAARKAWEHQQTRITELEEEIEGMYEDLAGEDI